MLDRLFDSLATKADGKPFRKIVQCESMEIYWDLLANNDLIGLTLDYQLDSARARGLPVRTLLSGPQLPALSIAIVHRDDFPQNLASANFADYCREASAIYVHPGSSV